jgi:hypothetical protein
MTGSALTAGLSKEAKTSSVLGAGVDVGTAAGGTALSAGGTAVAVGGTAVSVGVGASSSGETAVSLGTGVKVGVDAGPGAHVVRSMLVAEKTTRSALSELNLLMGATLLESWPGGVPDLHDGRPTR